MLVVVEPGLRVRDNGAGWWPLVAFVICGLAGGAIGASLALMSISGGTTWVELGPFPFLVGSAALGGGVVIGWFVAILILARTPNGARCPRCGTTNPKNFTQCRACDLGQTIQA